ncbi:hypothetical protein F5Y16DRAFT_403972 [Xylariaceae sp. FL0255]|nr:hypothetical protein F5Y16DRAFT_403972 [Xylariaceae sp. FL0255]
MACSQELIAARLAVVQRFDEIASSMADGTSKGKDHELVITTQTKLWEAMNEFDLAEMKELTHSCRGACDMSVGSQVELAVAYYKEAKTAAVKTKEAADRIMKRANLIQGNTKMISTLPLEMGDRAFHLDHDGDHVTLKDQTFKVGDNSLQPLFNKRRTVWATNHDYLLDLDYNDVNEVKMHKTEAAGPDRVPETEREWETGADEDDLPSKPLKHTRIDSKSTSSEAGHLAGTPSASTEATEVSLLDLQAPETQVQLKEHDTTSQPAVTKTEAQGVKPDGMFDSDQERMDAIDYHASLMKKNRRIDIPRVFTYGIRFTPQVNGTLNPDSTDPNYERRMIVFYNVPKDIKIFEILAKVRGGKIVTSWKNDDMAMAMIMFAGWKPAKDYFDYFTNLVNNRNLKISG